MIIGKRNHRFSDLQHIDFSRVFGWNMTGSLQGKSILVTAAAAGIGKAIAQEAANEGAKVTAADINTTELEKIACDDIKTIGLDVTDQSAINRVINTSEPFDCIANVAGYVHHGNLLNCDFESWKSSFAINVDSMFLILRVAVPKMIQNGGGSIVNISSVVSSIKGLPDRFAYGSSKAAILGLTKSVACDFLSQGIRCNAVCPGTVDSPSWRKRCEELGKSIGSYEQAREYFELRQPMKRLGTAEEVAGLSIYLLSERSAFITGQFFNIDGGIMV